MYKNSIGLSRLEADGTGLSLPPLIPSTDPSPRMSIVNEGLREKRNSNLGSLQSNRLTGSKPNSYNDDYTYQDDEISKGNNSHRYKDKSKTNSRVNLDDNILASNSRRDSVHSSKPKLASLKDL